MLSFFFLLEQIVYGTFDSHPNSIHTPITPGCEPSSTSPICFLCFPCGWRHHILSISNSTVKCSATPSKQKKSLYIIHSYCLSFRFRIYKRPFTNSRLTKFSNRTFQNWKLSVRPSKAGNHNMGKFYSFFNMFAYLNIIFIFFAFQHVHCGISPHPLTIESPTGHQISSKLLRNHFPDHPFSSLHQKLVDITSEYDLISHDLNFNLLNRTNLHQVTYTNHPAVHMNGKPFSQTLGPIHVRIGNEITMTMSEGRIITVVGPNIRLSPLDENRYPGVYINKYKISSSQKVGDIIVKPPQQDRRKPMNIIAANQTSAIIASCSTKSYTKVIEIAVAFDSTFCDDYVSKRAAVAAARGIMAAAEVPYIRQTCLTFNVVFIDAACSSLKDVYAPLRTRSDLLDVLGDVRDIWKKSPRSRIERDLVVFLAGFADKTTTAGLAWLPGTCSDFAYAAVEGKSDYIAAHEIGHSLGCEHDTSGIMMGAVPQRKKFVFSAKSISEMMSFIDSPDASCITISNSRNLQVPAPSSSPDVLPPNPLQSPNPGNMKMCSAGFQALDKHGMACAERIWSLKIPNLNSRYQFTLQQQFGRFDVTVQAPPQKSGKPTFYYINNASLSVSTSMSQSGELQMSHNFGETSTVTRDAFEWPVDRVSQPSSKTSCCRLQLYFHFQLSGRRVSINANNSRSVSASIIRTFQWKVRCLNCKSGQLTKMSSEVKCPLC